MSRWQNPEDLKIQLDFSLYSIKGVDLFSKEMLVHKVFNIK